MADHAGPTDAAAVGPQAVPVATAAVSGREAPSHLAAQTVQPEQIPAAGPEHVPVASRLPLVSWGDGSAPSLPSIDDGASEMSLVSRRARPRCAPPPVLTVKG